MAALLVPFSINRALVVMSVCALIHSAPCRRSETQSIPRTGSPGILLAPKFT
jgi:hypothetical protein